MIKLSLVIPCYNESKNLPLLLERCSLIANPEEVEVIIVDNGSNDSTQEVLQNILKNYPGCRSVRIEVNQGYGFGIMTGLKSAKGELMGWTHADLQTDPKDVLDALKFFNKSEDLIFCKGRRFGRPILDVLFTISMSFFETILLGKLMWDINAQPTIFSRHFFEKWQNPLNDFSLDLYAYYMAKKFKLKVCRFPVKFGERAYGISHWNIDWKSKWNFIKRTISYSINLRRNV